MGEGRGITITHALAQLATKVSLSQMVPVATNPPVQKQRNFSNTAFHPSFPTSYPASHPILERRPQWKCFLSASTLHFHEIN